MLVRAFKQGSVYRLYPTERSKPVAVEIKGCRVSIVGSDYPYLLYGGKRLSKRGDGLQQAIKRGLAKVVENEHKRAPTALYHANTDSRMMVHLQCVAYGIEMMRALEDGNMAKANRIINRLLRKHIYRPQTIYTVLKMSYPMRDQLTNYDKLAAKLEQLVCRKVHLDSEYTPMWFCLE